jgi:hypothetical protein
MHVDEQTTGWDAGFFHPGKTHGTEVRVDEATIGRDVGFFLIFFAVAAGVGLVELPFLLKAAVAVLLVGGYAYYVRLTLLSGGRLEEVPENLTLWPFGSRPPLLAVFVQFVGALGLMGIDYQGGKVYEGARWHNMRVGEVPVVMLVRDGATIPHADLAQSTDGIDWYSLELKVFCARATAAEGLVCLPEDGELHALHLERANNGFALEGDALGGRVAWRFVPSA